MPDIKTSDVVWDATHLSDLRTGNWHTIRLRTDPAGHDYLEIEGTPLPVRWVSR